MVSLKGCVPLDELVGVDAMAWELRGAAAWRRRVADRYPWDAERNLRTASDLERLAGEVESLNGSDLYRTFLEVAEVANDPEQEVKNLIQDMSLHVCASGQEFLERLIHRFKT